MNYKQIQTRKPAVADAAATAANVQSLINSRLCWSGLFEIFEWTTQYPPE
jgi:hypothetical protein